MKQLKTIIFILAAFVLPALAQYAPMERQPFSDNRAPVLRSPADDLPDESEGGGTFIGGGNGNGNGSGGPGEGLPNDNTGGGGWVGMPAGDALWILPLLTAGYEFWRRRKIKN